MSTLQVALKIVLFLLSAIFYGICSTPPHPTPKGSTASTPSGLGLREWFVVIRITYVLPLQKIGFYAAAFNECIHIFGHRDIVNVSIDTLFIVAAFFSIFGGLIRFLCYRELGECFTFELVPVGQNAVSASVARNPKLVTTGPYSYVRHPSYLGLWMCFFGSTMIHMIRGSWMRESGFLDTLIGRLSVGSWIFAVGSGAVLVTMRVWDEDELMKKQFGKEWLRWSRVVQYRMIPGVF